MINSIKQRLGAVPWRDWRVRWILGTPLAAILASAIFYAYVPSASDPSTFGGALFASWLGGLILTVVITLVITIVTLPRPDREVFEARARNLLRRQTGPHIDYIIPELQKLLEPYCEQALREMTVTEYDEKERLFRINQYTDNRLKSYLNDMPVMFGTMLAYKNGTPAPEGRENCSLTYLRVDGNDILESDDKALPHGRRFEGEIEVPFEMRVRPDEVCRIEHRMVYWVKASTEPNRHRPTRFTNHLRVIVHNHLPSKRIWAVYPHKNGKEERIPILAGTSEVVVDLVHLRPSAADEYVYDFRLETD